MNEPVCKAVFGGPRSSSHPNLLFVKSLARPGGLGIRTELGSLGVCGVLTLGNTRQVKSEEKTEWPGWARVGGGQRGVWPPRWNRGSAGDISELEPAPCAAVSRDLNRGCCVQGHTGNC